MDIETPTGYEPCVVCEKNIPIRPSESVKRADGHICLECQEAEKAADPSAEHAPQSGPPADYAPGAGR